jgi:beta-lactamase regulating signal transducer with metallopeptidase domain
MPEAIVPAIATVAGWLLTYLVHSTVLLLGAWVLSRGDRFAPATRDLLWKTAIVGGLVTSAVAMAGTPSHARLLVMELSTVEDMGAARTEAAPSFGWTAGDPDATRKLGLVGALGALDAVVASRGGLAPLVERAGAMSPVTPWTWFDGMVVVWLVGALWGLGRLARQWMGLKGVFAGLRSPSERMARVFATVLTKDASVHDGRGPIGLRSSDTVDSPCVLPGRLIVLPGRCDEELSDEELTAVLAHELAHVRRRDSLWAAVMTGFGAVFWFQPMNRLALRASQQAAEHACDDYAVSRTGDPLSLASSITRVARWTVDAQAPVTLVSMVGRRGPGLADRVGRVLDGGPPRSEPRWARILLATALLLPLRWLPAVEPPTFVRAAFVSERLVIERSTNGPEVSPPEIHVMRVRTVRAGGDGAS